MNILEEAGQLIHGDRQVAYGPPAQHFARIAQIWSALLDAPISAEQVALCMCALKLARQVHSGKRDNLVDAAGYLALIELL